VIDGGTEGESTVNLAGLLVIEPMELLTMTSNIDPLSELVVAGVA
jgi:hypothetical protein